MASTANYLDPRVLAELDGLLLRTRHVVDGWLSGSHRNLDPGTSTEYSQHRQYVPGDDLRHVDWKAYGRTDRIYVKQFLDETNLACTFLLDASGSMRYHGSRSPLSKLHYGECIVGSLAWLLQHQGDAVGISISSGSGVYGEIKSHLPPASSEYQLTELIHRIENTRASGDSDIAVSLRDWGMRTDRRQLLVVVSDFFGDQPMLHKALTDLRGFGHDVLLIQVCDRDEIDFPFDRFTEFSGMESSDAISLDADIYRQGYLEKFAESRAGMQQHCLQSGIDFVPMVSDEPLGRAIGNFLLFRGRPQSGD